MIYRGPGFLAVVCLAPSPSCQQVISLSQSSCVSPVVLTDGTSRMRGVGEEPKYTTAKQPGSLQIIQYSLLFATKDINKICVHCKKRLAVFPSPAGMSLTKLSWTGIIKKNSRPGTVWLVPAVDGKTANPFFTV
jgi:hypothetical protein